MNSKWDLYAIDGANRFTYIGLSSASLNKIDEQLPIRLLDSIVRDTKELLRKGNYIENAKKEYASAKEERARQDNRDIWPVSLKYLGETTRTIK